METVVLTITHKINIILWCKSAMTGMNGEFTTSNIPSNVLNMHRWHLGDYMHFFGLTFDQSVKVEFTTTEDPTFTPTVLTILRHSANTDSCSNSQMSYTLTLAARIPASSSTTTRKHKTEGLEETVEPFELGTRRSSGRSDTERRSLPFKCRGKKPCCSDLH